MKAKEALSQYVWLFFEDSHYSLNSRLKAFFLFLRIFRQFSKILFDSRDLFYELRKSHEITIQSFKLLVLFPAR